MKHYEQNSRRFDTWNALSIEQNNAPLAVSQVDPESAGVASVVSETPLLFLGIVSIRRPRPIITVLRGYRGYRRATGLPKSGEAALAAVLHKHYGLRRDPHGVFERWGFIREVIVSEDSRDGVCGLSNRGVVVLRRESTGWLDPPVSGWIAKWPPKKHIISNRPH